ncbi:uncharacterized protein LTR77_005928 [Saxophila tyrrhenica]|uniref:RED-like N-terminal domain-containing protein n=1 Tax=Saxophila tyrrhenica TaxID=1690608 RepID=A0AAV9P9I8_9PEZI|nr:hypothetical protein LTR77_005928 [Saxophila tyrrhenica]
MNNQQFRRLLATSPTDQHGKTPPGQTGAASSNLGGKRSSFMPMTPRTVGKGGMDVDFARQVRERNVGERPTKKFKTATPRGVKYGAGYTDRAKARAEAEGTGDDKEERIKALEEQMKLGQIPEEVFYSLREEITGGDVGSTHLVKGLDRKLLERVRRGEDVLGTGGGENEDEPPPDVDEELDKLEEREVEAVQKEKALKKGSMAPPPVAGVKRSRDEIMTELKAQRKAAADAKAAPSLDTSKWRKVGDKKSRVEMDHKGREVLITMDEDGIVKRKVRKVPLQDTESAAEMPDVSKTILGADAVIPETSKVAEKQEDEDDDIFEGVGTEYNPLGDEVSDDEGSGDDSDAADPKDDTAKEPPSRRSDEAMQSSGEEGEISQASSPEPDTEPAINHEDTRTVEAEMPKPAAAPRNYFRDTLSTSDEPAQDRLAGVQDLLKKAAKMDSTREDADEGDEEQKAKAKRRQDMLAQRDRDLDDMDMGFGGSRYDEGEEDGDGKKVRLSEWKGGADDGWEEKEKGGGKKKRKPKKRKGDANNMADIMRVMEGRKTGGEK